MLASYLGSRAAQLANHLRDSILSGRMAEPLPGMRLWSDHLGVSRPTLRSAIEELADEGLLTIKKRGVRLMARSSRRWTSFPQVVRLLYFHAWQPHMHQYYDVFTHLEERLRTKNILLTLEICNPVRLRAIARHPHLPNEMLILSSVPNEYQRLFEGNRRAIAWGEVEPGSRLPFVAGDQAGTVRHAAMDLMRRGFTSISLVHVDVKTAGLLRVASSFLQACAEWPGRIERNIYPTALGQQALLGTARRIALRPPRRHGIITLAPVPIGMIMTAVLQHGIRVPEDTEVVALFHSAEAVQLYPPPIYYPRVVPRQTAYLAKAAVAYFETGRVPTLSQLTPTEPVKPPLSGIARPKGRG